MSNYILKHCCGCRRLAGACRSAYKNQSILKRRKLTQTLLLHVIKSERLCRKRETRRIKKSEHNRLASVRYLLRHRRNARDPHKKRLRAACCKLAVLSAPFFKNIKFCQKLYTLYEFRSSVVSKHYFVFKKPPHPESHTVFLNVNVCCAARPCLVKKRIKKHYGSPKLTAFTAGFFGQQGRSIHHISYHSVFRIEF